MGYYLVVFTDGNPQAKGDAPLWEEWDQEISNALVDGANAEEGLVVTKDEALKMKSDYTKGYRIIKASNFEQAVEISKGAPPLCKGGRAEVYPIQAAVG